MAVVFPGEVDLAVGEPCQARVGQGDAMGIAAEIGQNLLGSCERALGEDDPLDSTQPIETVGECGGFGQGHECAGEAQFTRRECRLQPCEEQLTEPTGKDPHRQKEAWPTRHPPRAQAATRDDAVQVRMMTPTPTIP